MWEYGTSYPALGQGRSRSSAVQVIDRAVRILDAISEEPYIALTSLSRKTNLTLTTTKRIIDSLRDHDFIQKSPDGRRYALGPRFQTLVTQNPDQRRLVQIARPILEKAARELCEDVAVAMLRGKHAVIIDRVLGPRALKIVPPLGAPVTLNCGYRRVLLAFQPSRWIDEYIQRTPFIKYTRSTITSRRELLAALEQIRTTGFSVSRGEYVQEAGGVAAPVFGPDKHLSAVLFSYVPILRFDQAHVTRHVACVTAAAKELSDILILER